MKSGDALRVLADVTAYQWGMVTSAQASMHGISRLDLSRLADAGHLKRLAHGVYMDAGAPGGRFDDLRAAWLSTDPKVMGVDRIHNRAGGVVVAGTSAARIHGIGDLPADRHEFISPTRRQTQRAEVHYRQRLLDPQDVTLAAGLPTMTVERTIADLVEEVADLSLVADVLRDAALAGNLDATRLVELLGPLAKRQGLPAGDGTALLHRLMEIAGIDADAVARRVAEDETLGSRITAAYLQKLDSGDLARLLLTPQLQATLESVGSEAAARLYASIAPSMPTLPSDVLEMAGIDEIAKTMTEQLETSHVLTELGQSLVRAFTERLATSDVLKEFGQSLGKSLAPPITEPDMLSAIREIERVVADG